MHRFAFIIHPLDARDVARKYPFVKWLPETAVHFLMERKSPTKVSEIVGVRSKTGAETAGWFIGCPLTTKQMQTLPLEMVYDRILQCGHIAEELGAAIVGLGAFTSVVGDSGITIARGLRIAVTTGNSYTVATALEGTERAAAMMEIDLRAATIAVVGATGSIGRTCALALGPKAAVVNLVGRSEERLALVREQVAEVSPGRVMATTDVKAGLIDADVIVSVTSAGMPIIQPDHLKPGAVVCDVARPRDVSRRVVETRNDVLVIEGGVVHVPGSVNFNFDFGFPDRTAYACMSETMLLALEGRIESFTLGKDVSVEQVDTMKQLAHKHGFELAGFRSFERAVTEEHIATVRENARARRKSLAGKR